MSTTFPTMMNTSTTTIPSSPAAIKKASSASANSNNKPKRPLSAYNLFYRYKRAKVLEAHKLGNDTNKDATIRLVTCTPGLEDYAPEETLSTTMTQSQLDELSRTEIRSALLNNLSPNDTRKRVHRKSHGAMSFLEMNKIMVASWKNIDDKTRCVFEELAEIGRRMYHKRVAEYEEDAASSSSSQAAASMSSSSPSSPSSSSSSFMSSNSSFSLNESPKKKMKIVNDNNNNNITSPPVSPQPQQTMWNSVVVDEVDMSKNIPTFFVPSCSTTFTSRRVSIESTCDGSHFDGYPTTDDVLTCVTTPMRFPEMQVKNKRSNEGSLIVDFPPFMEAGASPSYSSTMMLQQQQHHHQQHQQRDDSLVVDFPASPKSTNMDFDTLDLDSPLPAYFDKMFEDEEDDTITDTSSLDDISMARLDSSCEHDFNVPSFEEPQVSMMNNKHRTTTNNNMEPSVDDFLKLIAQLDESLPVSSRAMAA